MTIFTSVVPGFTGRKGNGGLKLPRIQRTLKNVHLHNATPWFKLIGFAATGRTGFFGRLICIRRRTIYEERVLLESISGLTRDFGWEFLLLHRRSLKKKKKKKKRTCTKRTRAPLVEDLKCVVVFGQRTASPTLLQHSLSNTTWLGRQCLLSRTGTLEMNTMPNELRLKSAGGRSLGHGR